MHDKRREIFALTNFMQHFLFLKNTALIKIYTYLRVACKHYFISLLRPLFLLETLYFSVLVATCKFLFFITLILKIKMKRMQMTYMYAPIVMHNTKYSSLAVFNYLILQLCAKKQVLIFPRINMQMVVHCLKLNYDSHI